ncbi:MAG: RNA methyltransferase [Bacteroidota bacterium]
MISKNNSKFIKSLKLKKFRAREKCFLVEGEKNIVELFNSPFKVRQVIGTLSLLEKLMDQGISFEAFEVTSPSVLADLGTFKTNDSGIAVAEFAEVKEMRFQGVLIALDGVSDPGNLGTIIRTMDWFGFTNLICSEDCADFYNPKTIAATMGSFCRVIPDYQNLENLLSSTDLSTYGLVLDGSPLGSHRLGEGIYVMGSESHGIRDALKPFIQNSLTIEKYGQAESLNVAMASGILLHTLKSP